jgi:tRNA pseudouridine13 synthase
MSTIAQPPLATASLPGIGGRIKAVPEDFEVEEIPAYSPSGSGDFLYLWMEKRGLGAEFFQREIAKRLGLVTSEVGTAGLKDRHALTRQWVSVPASAEPDLARLEGGGMRVLSVGRHTNKLRAGHLRGNRFRIAIRDIARDVDVLAVVQAVVEQLRGSGLPNFYGHQRFGHDGETLLLGQALLHGKPAPALPDGRRPNLHKPFLRKLCLSAVQAALFNDYLAARMNDGLLQRVLPGDVMARWPHGGMFVAEDVPAEQARFDRREIVTAGPIFGRKTFPARDEAAAREAAVLAAASLTRESFGRFGKLLMGSRRHNVVFIDDLTADLQLEHLQLTFSLPAGSYATVLLREIMKTNLEGDREAGEQGD